MQQPTTETDMISPIGTDTSVGVRGQRSATRVSELDRLAARGGVPASPVRGFVENGGRISFVRGAPLAGLPLTPDGAPDFEHIIAAGGKIEGALPDGCSSMTTVGIPGANSRQTVYAAQVTLVDGSTRYVKGGTMAQDKDDASETDTLRALRDLLDYIDSLPNDIAEARSRYAGASARLVDIRV
jgi:hypothetical protein